MIVNRKYFSIFVLLFLFLNHSVITYFFEQTLLVAWKQILLLLLFASSIYFLHLRSYKLDRSFLIPLLFIIYLVFRFLLSIFQDISIGGAIIYLLGWTIFFTVSVTEAVLNSFLLSL